MGILERGVLDAGGAVSSEQLGALELALAETRSGNDVAAYAIALP